MPRVISVSKEDVAASESTGGGGFLYPAGEYVGKIIDIQPAKDGFAKQGAHADTAKYPAFNVKVEFTESGTGVGIGKKYVAWQVPDFPTFASGKKAWLFTQFYKALGLIDGEGDAELPDLSDPDEAADLLDREIGLRLEIQEGQDNPNGGKYPDRNRVAAFYSAEKGVTESTPVQALTKGGKAKAPDEFTL
jgi:hypothetical protein